MVCLHDRDVHGKIGTIGILWVPWDSHGNGSDNDYITGMGVGIKVWEWE